MTRFFLTWDTLTLLWRRRGTILRTLLNAEELVRRLDDADSSDLRDIHALDSRVYEAMMDVVYGIRPVRTEAILGEVIE